MSGADIAMAAGGCAVAQLCSDLETGAPRPRFLFLPKKRAGWPRSDHLAYPDDVREVLEIVRPDPSNTPVTGRLAD
jgi:hypothetical protein